MAKSKTCSLCLMLKYCWLLYLVKGGKRSNMIKHDILYLLSLIFSLVCRAIGITNTRVSARSIGFRNCMGTRPEKKKNPDAHLQVSPYITLSLYSNKEEIVCSATGEVIRWKGRQKNICLNSLLYFCT